MVPGTRMDPIQWVIESIKAGLPSILHGLRAKGNAAALIKSKNSMWPVAEFSRSHVCARGGGPFFAERRPANKDVKMHDQ